MASLKPDPIDVLTPLGACVLFGRSGEAVRRAVREGHVATPLSLSFTAKEIRLIDLKSARRYWAEDPWPTYRRPFKEEIAEMRRFGVTLKFGGIEYAVLHPSPLVHTGHLGWLDHEAVIDD